MKLFKVLMEQEVSDEIKSLDKEIKQAQLDRNTDLVRLLQRKRVLLNNMAKLQNDIKDLDVQIARTKAQQQQPQAGGPAPVGPARA